SQIGEHQAETAWQQVQSQEALNVADQDLAIINQNESGQYLSDKFLYRRKNDDIIFQTHVKNDNCSSKIKRQIRTVGKITKKKNGEEETGENTQSPQSRNGRLMYLPLIRDVVDFLYCGHPNYYRNR